MVKVIKRLESELLTGDHCMPREKLFFKQYTQITKCWTEILPTNWHLLQLHDNTSRYLIVMSRTSISCSTLTLINSWQERSKWTLFSFLNTANTIEHFSLTTRASKGVICDIHPCKNCTFCEACITSAIAADVTLTVTGWCVGEVQLWLVHPYGAAKCCYINMGSFWKQLLSWEINSISVVWKHLDKQFYQSYCAVKSFTSSFYNYRASYILY